jgi:hypothetical protein
MATNVNVNPLTGREEDVLRMCKHFLEDDRIKDPPTIYSKKMIVLTRTVTYLKHLYGNKLNVNHLIDFLTKKDVMNRDFHEVELKGACDDKIATVWFKTHLCEQEYHEVINELASELRYLPH